jgi:orotidine-5'-phosphate decarboxylase
MKPRNPLCVALDTADLAQALAWGRAAAAHAGVLKVGFEFIHAQGPEGIRAIAALGLPVFADVKLHDIPNTVAGAVRALKGLGVALLNVHAAGGSSMMAAAKEAAGDLTVIAVTVLTSLDQGDLMAAGVTGTPLDHAVRLARLAKSSGLDGVVCSAEELGAIGEACGPGFLTVVPGIRPQGASAGDQKRVMTPKAAVSAGADLIVVGRPITGAPDPGEAARAILESLA